MHIAVVAMHPVSLGNGGTQRVRSIVDALVSLDIEVTLVRPAEPGHSDWSVNSVQYGSAQFGQRNVPNFLRSAKRLLAPLPTGIGARGSLAVDTLDQLPGVDLVCVPFPLSLQFMGYRVPLWADFHDLMSRFAAWSADQEADARRRLALKAQSRSFARSETKLSASAALRSTAGFGDYAALTSLDCRTPIIWMPPTYPATPLPSRTLSDPPTAGIIADFRYFPNSDAYQNLVNSWAPDLLEAGWKLLVAGFGSNELPAHPGVSRLGPLNRVKSFYESIDLALAPVRVGGGIKVKIIEALAYGRPVLASSFAVDGLPRPAPQGIHLFEDVGAPSPEFVRSQASPLLPSYLDAEHHPAELRRALESAVR